MTLNKATNLKALLILLTIFIITSCTQGADKKDCTINYEEADLPVTVTTNWAAVPAGLQASMGSIDERYIKHEVPDTTNTFDWNGTAWRGERVSSQLILWSKDSVPNIEFKLSDFRSANNETISAGNTQVRFVRYVITDEFGQGCGERKPDDYDQSLSADVLDDIDCMPIKAETARPVWITIDVPMDAVAGTYNATLEISTDGKKEKEFILSLHVLDQTLPPASEWAFHLDLWQNPYAVARSENVEPWSDEHWKALEKPMQMLAAAGQKVITTTLNKRPWNGQTEDPFDTMIEWKKKTDGTWEFDYTVFDN